MRIPAICTAALVFMFHAITGTPAMAQASDPNAARDLAATCAMCHGTGGVSQGIVTSLAGIAKEDLATKLQEFKAGKRTGTIMPQLAKGFSDEQIDLVAAWYAAQKK